MASWGGTCPACGEPFSGLKDRKRMGTHKTPYYLPFSNRRETCVYSRGTREDAARKITPLVRRTVERLRAIPPTGREPHEVAYLIRFESKHGIGA
jgi:heterodisulfide reductase subunit A-like polyferredoxin